MRSIAREITLFILTRITVAKTFYVAGDTSVIYCTLLHECRQIETPMLSLALIAFSRVKLNGHLRVFRHSEP